MNLTDEFTALIVGFQAANIDFAVCGGLAMSLHGFPRYTKDLDFLVQPADLPRILEITQKCGYDKEVEILSLGPRESPTCEIRRINKFRGEDHLMVDFIFVSRRLEDVWAGQVAFSWQGLTVPVVSAAGLAKMKRLANRPQDLVDIETLGFKPDDPTIQP
jgi:Nucleotidyl transferase AbiEii toxin, Type IV TA system